VLVVGDFNKDGKPDLAVAAFQSDAVFVLLGNGDGTFQSPVEYAVGREPDGIAMAVESLHMSLRKIIKTRGSFPSEEAAVKLLYYSSAWRPMNLKR
jgi:hypothetical protein